MNDTITKIASVEKKDTISDSMSKLYDLGIEHAINIVKEELIHTTDINTLMVMSHFKNSLISKLLSLQK